MMQMPLFMNMSNEYNSPEKEIYGDTQYATPFRQRNLISKRELCDSLEKYKNDEL